MKRKSNTSQTAGLLLNKAGSGRYNNPDSIEHVIKYIARKNGETENDLICCGALGATDFTDIDTTIRQFRFAQLMHRRRGNFGRYIDHEIYSFSSEEEAAIRKANIPIENIVRKMAQDFYADGFQVYYGVHTKDDTMEQLHVHFAVNTVNFRTGNKRRENKTATKQRLEKLKKIILAETGGSIL